MPQRRSGVPGPGCWSGYFSRDLGLPVRTPSGPQCCGRVWEDVRPGWCLVPEELASPLGDTGVGHPESEAGPGNPGHRDRGEKCGPNDDG